MLLDIITIDSTDQSLSLRMCDAGDGTLETGVVAATPGLNIWYRRDAGPKVNITPSDLSLLTDAHSDGGILHVAHGKYRVDCPDAAFAAGAKYVEVGWGATGMIGFGGRVLLIEGTLGGNVLPVASTVSTGAVSSSDLVAYQYAAASFVFAIVDDDGNAVDLSGKSVSFTIFRLTGDRSALFTLDSLAVSGASNNNVTVPLTDTHTASHGRYGYVMRNDTDDTVLAAGELLIVRVPDKKT